MEKMKNVLFIVQGLKANGLEKYLLRYIKYSFKSYQQIHIYIASGKVEQLDNDFKAIKNVRLNYKNLGLLSIIDHIHLYRYIKRNMIESVVDFGGNFSGLNILTAFLARTNTRISSFRGSSNRFKPSIIKNLVSRIFTKITYIFSTKICFNSYSAVKFYYPSLYRTPLNKKINVIYNGYNKDDLNGARIDYKKILNLPKDAILIGNTARYHWTKNQDIIIEVASRICTQSDNVYFLIAGNSVPQNLNKKVSQLDLTSKVILIDHINDVASLLHSLDLFLFPSISEGQPNSLIEAIIVGVPFIASNIPSIAEFIPLKYKKNLFTPTSVNEIERCINNFLINKKINQEKMELMAYATTMFDAKKLFDEFTNVILY